MKSNLQILPLDQYEDQEYLIDDTYIVVRIDGKCFTPFCKLYQLTKPFDNRLIDLMVKCGTSVVERFPSIMIGYGQSDEFSFVFQKNMLDFQRRRDDLISSVVSIFASSFVFYWPQYFPGLALQRPPGFDARAVIYPTLESMKDYVKWRQADSYINCFYNYTLNVVVSDGIDSTTATEMLKGKTGDEKKKILLDHGIELEKVPEVHLRGTLIIRDGDSVSLCYDDILKKDSQFWIKYSHLFE